MDFLINVCAVPDFRSADGLFKSLQKKHNLRVSGKMLFDAAVYQDGALTASFHEMVRSLADEATKTSPTAFHHMLARLAQENRLTRLYTQNIDGIEASMPPLETQVPLNMKAPWPRTIQLHGSLSKMVCQKCRHMLDFQGRLFDGPDPPLCPACWETDTVRTTVGQRSHGVGKMRPRIVLYNEHNPDGDAIASVMNADVRSRPDALIVVGTSMKIPGVRCLVRNLCKVIRGRRNGKTIWINNDLPSGKEFDGCWDLVVKGDCEEVARLSGLKRWNDNSQDDDDTAMSECEAKNKKNAVSVVIGTPKKKQKTAAGPSASNDTASLQLSSPKKASPKKAPPKQSSPKKIESKQVSGGARSNPASKYPSINDVLRKESKAKKPEPKKPQGGKKKPSAPRKKASEKEDGKRNPKITQFATVAKNTKATTGHGKATKQEKDPMLPLPPGAARNNGPTFPNLISKRVRQT